MPIIAIASLCVSFGASKAVPQMDKVWHRMTWLLVNILYPCLIFGSVVSVYNRDTLIHDSALVWGGFAIMLTGYLFAPHLQKICQPLTSAQSRTLGVMATAGNYSFVPYPIALLLWGDQASTQVLLSTLGSDFGLWVLAVSFLVRSPKERLRKLLSPPLLTLLVTVSLVWFEVDINAIFPGLVASSRTIGNVVIPIAMAILGHQLAQVSINRNLFRRHSYMSALRLTLIPGVIYFVLNICDVHEGLIRVIMLVAIMPAAVASVFLSKLYDGDPRYAAEGILVSHILAIGSVPIWLLVVG